jgi:hypothetical protein
MGALGGRPQTAKDVAPRPSWTGVLGGLCRLRGSLPGGLRESGRVIAWRASRSARSLQAFPQRGGRRTTLIADSTRSLVPAMRSDRVEGEGVSQPRPQAGQDRLSSPLSQESRRHLGDLIRFNQPYRPSEDHIESETSLDR